MTEHIQNVPLQCSCGKVRGTAQHISPSGGFRFICYCIDCQTFSRFLNRPDMRDSAGGTDIFHMPMGRFKLLEGKEFVRSLRLSDKVLRWYADCCRTPIGNTSSGPNFPVMALILSFADIDARAQDDVFGMQVCRIFEKSATGQLPQTAPPPSFSVFLRRGRKLIGWWLWGLGKPSPFFDATIPISQPHRIRRYPPHNRRLPRRNRVPDF